MLGCGSKIAIDGAQLFQSKHSMPLAALVGFGHASDSYFPQLSHEEVLVNAG